MNAQIHKFKDKLKKVPQKPGIYIMRDHAGHMIYVGKAIRLRSRLQSHFLLKDSSLKEQAMVDAVADFDFIPLRSEEEALILECQYIKEYKPKYNIAYRDDKNYPWIKVTVQEEFPRLLISRLRKPDGALYLGPYTDAHALKTTLEELNRIFFIRTCSPSSPGQYDYDHCLYQMIRWCSAPCVGKIPKEEYRKSVEAACKILLGQTKSILSRMKKEMAYASHQLNFERAAQIRDRMLALEKIVETKTNLTRVLRRADSTAGLESKQLAEALGLDRPPRRIEAFDISNFGGHEAVGSMVCFVGGQPDKRFYRRFRIKTIQGIDDFAMMKEIISRRYRRLKEERGSVPDLILIDGGKGQLSSALKGLEEEGMAQIPVIGLAKRYEEIFTPYSDFSIRLSKDSGALRLIQRIRDEAHRFAVTYHKILRGKKLKESVLDDIPGVGRTRKEILLKNFGSIDVLRRAKIDTIKKVKGIDSNLAERIWNALNKKIS